MKREPITGESGVSQNVMRIGGGVSGVMISPTSLFNVQVPVSLTQLTNLANIKVIKIILARFT